ncbi:Putative 2-amino-3-carboxymuconate-6-semialdehyde decarboxylase, metal-dependent hydrolase [Septoria linicola]|uniref:2-amino-3-carboxymuconate-6-semialdehyde decarboxylase, metal-dependent hydrolase n=1 Tax=Septoria linicola TaxID=215465 RepID=A0A9Q9EHV8_9PEZI|nr:Putative 2-amino-3-carboxymuconate-6-semialdehyde decarboxylase, metal-dependent hydrolase [Septoria linicola]
MPTIDVHTHMYPPALMSVLRERKAVPYVRLFEDDVQSGERLVILPAEESGSTARGRPIGPEYYDVIQKIKFMDTHGIDISVVSIANPWLDWVSKDEAGPMAQTVNDDVERMCVENEGRLYHFGTLPLSAAVEDVVKEVERLKSLTHCRGIVMGTSGLGQGLDDARLDPIWQAIEQQQLLVFLHPHYGLPREVFGPRNGDYGHVLPLAMGFPLETTIAVTRMILSGIFDRFRDLNVLLAHSGGTLPFLAGRIESCIAHDAHLKKAGKIGGRRAVWDVLKKNIYLDAVIYADVGLKAAINASGADRIMFGTDHPFFPPLDEEDDQWLSVTSNMSAIKSALKGDEKVEQDILGGNAARVLRLTT